MMIEEYKRYDGQALGLEKVGECSCDGGEKIGDILAPEKTFHQTGYPRPIFPHSTNDFQKPIMFKSDLGNEFVGKEKDEKLSGEKPKEQPHPKPKPKSVRFHYDYCGRDGHKEEFCFKRKHEERMAKEWDNKDK
jgi:hypothetical protein